MRCPVTDPETLFNPEPAGNSDTGDVGFTDDIRNALERLFFQFEVGPPHTARSAEQALPRRQSPLGICGCS